jgi:hypothetical protein
LSLFLKSSLLRSCFSHWQDVLTLPPSISRIISAFLDAFPVAWFCGCRLVLLAIGVALNATVSDAVVDFYPRVLIATACPIWRIFYR